MAGRRHHTIPQFLLRGFASSKRGNEARTWLYRRGNEGLETNIINVGVEGDFYGKGDLDAKITELEGRYAGLVRELREAPDGCVRRDDAKLAELTAHLSLRTRQIRQSFQSITMSLLADLEAFFMEESTWKLLTRNQLNKDGPVRDALVKLLVEEHGVAEKDLPEMMRQLRPHLPALAKELCQLLAPLAMAEVEAHVSANRAALPPAIRAAFITSMSQNLSSPERLMKYSTYCWFNVTSSEPLLLGDSACIFETTGQRRFKPVDDVGDDVRAIYLPISASRLLVAARLAAVAPVVDFHDLNKVISRCSLEYFVSASELPKNSHLLPCMGGWSGVLSDRERRGILADLKKKFVS